MTTRPTPFFRASRAAVALGIMPPVIVPSRMASWALARSRRARTLPPLKTPGMSDRNSRLELPRAQANSKATVSALMLTPVPDSSAVVEASTGK
jgi:hypothetical protein